MELYANSPRKDEGNIKVYTDKDFYWGVSTRKEARDFIAVSKQTGFYEAVKKPEFEVFKKYALGTHRADFHFMLPLKRDAVILDLGSGYGNVTIPLAKHYKHVVAVDSTLELLQFSQEYARAESVSNIDYVHIDAIDFCNLPFKEKSFDAIIMNGVLEWVGTADTTSSAGDIQKKVLGYLKKFLKDDGFIFVGIENRFYLPYFFNVRDPHSKIRYTSIMPRFLANMYCRIRGLKDGYRTLIYSYWGYKRLFRSAGLNLFDTAFPLASYRVPSYIFYHGSVRARRWFIDTYLTKVYPYRMRYMFRMIFRLHLDRFFLDSFHFIAKKPLDVNVHTQPAVLRMALEAECNFLSSNFDLLKVDGKKEDDGEVQFLLFEGKNPNPQYKLVVSRDPFKNIVVDGQMEKKLFSSNTLAIYQL